MEPNKMENKTIIITLIIFTFIIIVFGMMIYHEQTESDYKRCYSACSWHFDDATDLLLDCYNNCNETESNTTVDVGDNKTEQTPIQIDPEIEDEEGSTKWFCRGIKKFIPPATVIVVAILLVWLVPMGSQRSFT